MEFLPHADTSRKMEEVKRFSLNRHHTFHILYLNFCADGPVFIWIWQNEKKPQIAAFLIWNEGFKILIWK